MNTRRLRLVRPKWTMGTMLLIVGWSPNTQSSEVLRLRLRARLPFSGF